MHIVQQLLFGYIQRCTRAKKSFPVYLQQTVPTVLAPNYNSPLVYFIIQQYTRSKLIIPLIKMFNKINTQAQAHSISIILQYYMLKSK